MSTPQQIQLPPQMIQQLLRGPTSPQKPPDVVEVLSHGMKMRLALNLDSVEQVIEYENTCGLLLKGSSAYLEIDMGYDEFLLAAKIQPRQLHVEHNQPGAPS